MLQQYLSGRRAFGLSALFLFCLHPLPAQAPDLGRAKQLMGEQRYAEAAALYAQAVAANPAETGLRMNLGMAQHLAGQDREAIGNLELVAKAQPGAYPAFLFLGLSHLRVNQPAKAVDPLTKAVALQPTELDPRRLLADALLMLNRYEQAVPHLRKLAAAAPQDPKGWFGLGRCYELLAQESFERLQKAAPQSNYWLALAAESRLKAKKYNSAFVLYREASAKSPLLPGVAAGLAEVYEATNHVDWAAQTRRKEQKLACPAPTLACQFQAGRFDAVVTTAKLRRTPEGYYWLTRAYNQLALEAFRKLTALPASAELHAIVAEMHRNAGRYAESIAEWNEAMRMTPGDPQLARELAVTLYLSKDWAGAATRLHGQTAREPQAADLQFMLGDSLLNQGQAAEAVPYLQHALQLQPDYPSAHASLARAYLQLTKPAEAVPHLEKALTLDTDGSLHYQLARAYQQQGRAREAQALLAKYQELAKNAEAEQGEITAPAP